MTSGVLGANPSPTPKNCTVRDALREGLRRLVAGQTPSATLAAELLLMHVLDCDRAYLYSHADRQLSPTLVERYGGLIAERLSGKPTQYITGHQEFWGLDFEITPDVLIPRPETEHLVEAILELAATERAAGAGPIKVVDVGTGSGCIALALAKECSDAEIYATDISPAALGVAARNAARLGLNNRVGFRETDLLTYFLKAPYLGAFDFVVSNPPYIGRGEIANLQREVREFEPRLAWGGLERGEDIYRQLFPQAQLVLKTSGWVAVEIGYQMRDRVLALLGHEWSRIEIRPDLAGIPRVALAQKPQDQSLRDG